MNEEVGEINRYQKAMGNILEVQKFKQLVMEMY